MFTRADHVALSVKDMEKAIAFYRDVVGMEKVFDREFDEVMGKLIGVPGTQVRIVHMKLADSVIELFDYRFLRPAELTFEQRRLAIYARELVKKPQLFLLEHPSLDLGERVYSFLLEVFKTCSMEDGCGFLVASMIPEVVNRWGDWVMVFDQGRCRRFEAGQFDPSIYRESMRRRGASLSREWRNG